QTSAVAVDVERRLRPLTERLFGDLGVVPHFHEAGKVLARVLGVLLVELFGGPVDDGFVEVFAAEGDVAVGGAGFERVAVDFDDRDIERAAAEIVNKYVHRFVGFAFAGGIEEAGLVTKGEGGGRRLVDDVEDVDTREPARVDRGPAAQL